MYGQARNDVSGDSSGPGLARKGPADLDSPVMVDERHQSLPDLFFRRAEELGARPFLWDRHSSRWRARSWEEAARTVRRLAGRLAALGIVPGERVLVASENRSEWLLADLAVMACGGVTVPAYTTNTVADHRFILEHSEAAAIIVANGELFDRVREAAGSCPGVRFMVRMPEREGAPPSAQASPVEGAGTAPVPPVHSWESLVASADAESSPGDEATGEDRQHGWAGTGPAAPEAARVGETSRSSAPITEQQKRGVDLKNRVPSGGRVAELTRESIACIIYTSGTGGTPKGVVLTHGSILCNVEAGMVLLQQALPHHRRLDRGGGVREEVFLSVLPISHAYEHTVGQYLAIKARGQIYYVASPAVLSSAMQDARPTIIAVVPRLLEVMRQRILAAADSAPPWRRRLFRLALRRATAACLAAADRPPGGAQPGAPERTPEHTPERAVLRRWPAGFEGMVYDRLVFSRVRRRFGGRLNILISGGAPMDPALGIFFEAIGLRVLQGYGLTESAPVVSCNPPVRIRHHTVGRPLDGVSVRLESDGEISLSGELVMRGYWRDEEATRAAIPDGWLRTGDIGGLDAEGYLFITDRKKDFIKTTGGEQISPQKVELALTSQPEIAQAAVFGDRLPQLVAVLVAEEETRRRCTNGGRGKPEGVAPEEDPELRRLLQAAVERANTTLAPPERIRRFILASEPFTIENGLMTPTLKVRRQRIRDVHGAQLASR